MQHSRTRLSIAPVALLLAVPAWGAAQTIPSAFEYLEERQELGVFAGVMSVDAGRFGYGPSGGPIFGVRYGIELSGPLSFEAVVGYVDAERDVIDPGRPEGDRVIGQASGDVGTIDARFKFSLPGRRSWHGFSPFLAAGGGVALNMAASSELDDVLLPEDVFEFGTSFFGTVSAGTRWFVTDKITARVDGTFSLWKIDTPPGFSDPERGFLGVEDGEWLAGQSISLSLLYRW